MQDGEKHNAICSSAVGPEIHNFQIGHVNLDVLKIRGTFYCLGHVVAELLNRETFNLYRSIRRRGIRTFKGSAVLVREIVNLGLSHSGTSSVTLIPFTEVENYIVNETDRMSKKRACEKSVGKDAKTKAKRIKSYIDAQREVQSDSLNILVMTAINEEERKT